jgi:hypothetical protein
MKLNHRIARTLLFLVSAGLIAFSKLAQAGAGAKVTVNKPERFPDEEFDPDNPPPEKPPGFAAFTKCEVMVECRHAFKTRIIKAYGTQCDVLVTVTEVNVTVDMRIQVFLPTGASPVLRAHEEGHVKICEDAYHLVAKKITEDVFKDFPATFTLTGVDPCTPEEIAKQAKARLDQECEKRSNEAAKQISAEVDKPGKKYDDATKNGTQGPGGVPPTEDNQKEAAKDAFKEYKKEWEKPKSK